MLLMQRHASRTQSTVFTPTIIAFLSYMSQKGIQQYNNGREGP